MRTRIAKCGPSRTPVSAEGGHRFRSILNTRIARCRAPDPGWGAGRAIASRSSRLSEAARPTTGHTLVAASVAGALAMRPPCSRHVPAHRPLDSGEPPLQLEPRLPRRTDRENPGIDPQYTSRLPVSNHE